MSGIRFQVDLFIPEPIDDDFKKEISQKILPAIRKLRPHARKINEGKDNEEMTVVAKWHICRHDEGLPCEPEQEI